MSNGAAAGAAAAAIVNAIKASGVLVRLAPEDFQSILQRAPNALVVHAEGGLFFTSYRYLTSYKGLAFFTKSAAPLSLPPSIEMVLAERIWIPG